MAGEILHVAGSVPPSGTLAANGQTISRATYANLFAAIGVTFGAGDGSTTFLVPDLRGEFIRGVDSGRGVDTGRVMGSAQIATQIVTDATVPAMGYPGIYTSDIRYNDQSVGLEGATLVAVSQRIGASVSLSSDANSLQHYKGTVRPRNIALLACIQY